MYFGGLIFFTESFNLIYTPLRNKEGEPTNRLVLDTICFHTFILMNLFNMINCRVVDAEEINVFKTLLNNPIFWGIIGFEILIQQLMINAASSTLGSALLGTAPLTTGMQITCWVFGALSLGVNVGIKKIPLDKFKGINNLIDIEGENKHPDFIARKLGEVNELMKKKKEAVMTAGA